VTTQTGLHPSSSVFLLYCNKNRKTNGGNKRGQQTGATNGGNKRGDKNSKRGNKNINIIFDYYK